MVVTIRDYAKYDVLTSLLSLVRRLHFIQSYTVTPTEGEKNGRVMAPAGARDTRHSSEGSSAVSQPAKVL